MGAAPPQRKPNGLAHKARTAGALNLKPSQPTARASGLKLIVSEAT